MSSVKVFVCTIILTLSIHAVAIGDPNLSIDSPSVTEANTQMSFTLSLDAVSASDVNVDWATAPVSATADSDYISASGTATISAGSMTTTVEVSILDDDLDEDSETFRVELSNAQNATLTSSAGTGTINDDGDAAPVLTLFDSTGDEGEIMVFGIALNKASGKAITFDYATAYDGTATAADFPAVSGSITIQPGGRDQQIDVPLTDDTLDEFAETFSVVITNESNVTLNNDRATGTILDNDPLAIVSISDASGEEGTALSFTVSLDTASGKEITVEYETVLDGDASALDLTETSGVITISPGATTQTISISTTEDALDEVDETFSVMLSNPTNAAAGTMSATGTIEDDDDPPTVSISDETVTEGETFTFTVSLDAPSGKTVSVEVNTNFQNSTEGRDLFRPPSGLILTFAPGETSKTISIESYDDNVDEPVETFSLEMSNPVNVTLGDNGNGTILDNDLPRLSISDASVVERNAPYETPVLLVVTMDISSEQTFTVDYTTVDGTATAGQDYRAKSGTLTFAPGDTVKGIHVTILGDNLDEDTETLTVELSNARVTNGAEIEIANGVGTLSIIDDDPTPTVSFEGDLDVEEAETTLEFTLTLDAPSGRDITIDYSTVDGTAKAGGLIPSALALDGDYVGDSGTITIPAGTTTYTLTVDLLDDDLPEQTERFTVVLSNPTNVILENDTVEVTIRDNDPLQNVVYRLRSFGSTYQYGQHRRVRSHGDAYLVVDPSRGIATALMWLRSGPRTWPVILELTGSGVATGYPVGRAGLDHQFIASIGVEGDVSAYSSHTFFGRTGRSAVDLGNGEQASLARRLTGTSYFGAEGFGPVQVADSVDTDGFDRVELDHRAVFDQRKTQALNAENLTFDEVVQALAGELELSGSLTITPTAVEPAVGSTAHTLVYRLNWGAVKTADGTIRQVAYRGFMVFRSDMSDAIGIFARLENGRRVYEVVDLADTEHVFYQQLGAQGVIGILEPTEAQQERPGAFTSYIWSGRVRNRLHVGGNIMATVPRFLNGDQVNLTLAEDAEDDAMLQGRSRLVLDLFATREANNFDQPLEVVVEDLTDRLEARHFEPIVMDK